MKTKIISLMGHCQAAPSNMIDSYDAIDLRQACPLDRHASKPGMMSHDLAGVHGDALHVLMISTISLKIKRRTTRQERTYFAEGMAAMKDSFEGEPTATTLLEARVGHRSLTTKAFTDFKVLLNEEMYQRITMKKKTPGSGLTSIELLTQSRWSQEQLRDLSRRLLSAQEEDKERISHELSNGIAQALISIHTKLDAMKGGPPTTNREFQKKLSLTQRLVSQSVDAVHRIACELRPAVLDDLGLVPALQSYMKLFFKRTGIHVTLTACGSFDALNGDARIVLYRVAQEALSNIAKHAKGSHVELSLHESRGFTVMEVRNTGHGFQANGAESLNDVQHLGILGMRERVEMIGGTFRVKSAPHKGTTIRAEIPRLSAGVGKQPSVSTIKAPHECL
jgi:signal transduction histidine kinase